MDNYIIFETVYFVDTGYRIGPVIQGFVAGQSSKVYTAMYHYIYQGIAPRYTSSPHNIQALGFTDIYPVSQRHYYYYFNLHFTEYNLLLFLLYMTPNVIPNPDHDCTAPLDMHPGQLFLGILRTSLTSPPQKRKQTSPIPTTLTHSLRQVNCQIAM